MLSIATSTLLRRTARPTASAALGSIRNLNVHEYISMELMNKHGIATPEGYVATTAEEAEDIFTNKMNKRTWYLIGCFSFFGS